MLRQIFRATEQRVFLDLPSEYVGHEVKMIAFCLDSPPITKKRGKKTLLDFTALLKSSANFNTDPVELQRELRNEWR